MTGERMRPANDGRFCMIYTPARRIVATACVYCRQSRNACAASLEVQRTSCCDECLHYD